MTSPTEDEIASKFATSWEYARHLADRVRALETWRARQDAVSAWRRWALPTAIGVVGLALTVANLVIALRH